jgi:RNA polymerase sigma-70 factor, ECF subfamily
MKNLEERLKDMMILALQDDKKAYHQMLITLSSWLRARALRFGLPYDEAEEVVQEALFAVHLKRQTWRQDAPFLPWVAAILRYKMIDRLRKRKNAIHVPLDDFGEDMAQDEPSETAHISIERFLPTLSPQQRQIVLGITQQGLSYPQLAEKLAISEATLRVNLHRAIKHMQRIFQTQEKI